MRKWLIREAKACFSKLVQDSKKSPQIVTDRGRPVAAMISFELFERLQKILKESEKPTVLQTLSELKEINKLEPDGFEALPRADRHNPLLDDDHESMAG